MAQHAPLVAVDRAPLGTICIDRQPRSQPKGRLGIIFCIVVAFAKLCEKYKELILSLGAFEKVKRRRL